MKKQQIQFILVASIACIAVCIGDFLVSLALGFFYPNYNHLKLVMSELGTSQSPAAMWINLWWTIFGIFFFIFAIGVRKAFAAYKKSAAVVMVLIMLFGLGAWICSGLFPIDPGGLEMTPTARLHGICGGIAYLAIMFVPLAALGIFSIKQSPKLFWLSIGVFLLGLAFFVLFVASEDAFSVGGLLSYAGLWQRLFLLSHYSYLSVVAVMMMGRHNPHTWPGTSQ
jgi:hypothetical protein